MAYKIIGQVVPTVGSPTPLLVSAQGAQSVISSITVANFSTSATDYFTIRVVKGADSDNDKQYIAYKMSVAPQSNRTLTLGITLDTADTIKVTCDNKTCAFNAFGTVNS